MNISFGVHYLNWRTPTRKTPIWTTPTEHPHQTSPTGELRPRKIPTRTNLTANNSHPGQFPTEQLLTNNSDMSCTERELSGWQLFMLGVVRLRIIRGESRLTI